MTGNQSLLEAARALAPKIRAAADQVEAERELPRPLFEALADAGFYHVALPRSLGCPELDLPTYILLLEELGKADASTAWTINQGAIYATYSARMPPALTLRTVPCTLADCGSVIQPAAGSNTGSRT